MAFKWNELDNEPRAKIPARPDSGLWTPARNYLGSGTILRMQATGRWKPLPALECGADGLSHWAFARDRLLMKTAPLGALIGKIGGSNIGTDGDMFVVGSLCVLKVEKTEGPLFLTINDAPDGFVDNEGAVTVEFI